jgi:hypothetical protein
MREGFEEGVSKRGFRREGFRREGFEERVSKRGFRREG